MVYVKDVAAAMIAVANHRDTIGFEVYNVATGASVSNNQILTTLKEHFSDLSVTHAPERLGDVKHTLACINKVGDEIGWSPQEQFWDGLEKTLKWWDLIE
jgi:nucleoside-diphosphate-sugar epimerase